MAKLLKAFLMGLILLMLALAVTPSGLFVNKSAHLKLHEKNAVLLAERIKKVCKEYRLYTLEELTPFVWDEVFFFYPYTTAEEIYAKIGYKWADITEIINEGQQNIVFTKGGKVVCDVFVGYDNSYYLDGPAQNSILVSARPRFMATWIVDDADYVSLSFYQTDLPDESVFHDTPEDLVGNWRLEETVAQPYQIDQYVAFTLIQEGIVEGRFWFQVPDPAHLDDEWWRMLGTGSLSFSGTLDGTVINCTIKENLMKNEIHLADEMVIRLEDGQFVIDVRAEGRLESGEPIPLAYTGTFTKR